MINLPLNCDFTGKVVVVTGAGGVLCGDMARAYAQAGAKVAALDLNEEAVLKLAAEVCAEGFTIVFLHVCRAFLSVNNLTVASFFKQSGRFEKQKCTEKKHRNEQNSDKEPSVKISPRACGQENKRRDEQKPDGEFYKRIKKKLHFSSLLLCLLHTLYHIFCFFATKEPLLLPMDSKSGLILSFFHG